MTATLDNVLEWWASTTPDRPALVFGGEPLTYRELNAWADCVANELAMLGVAVGDRVCIFAGNSETWCVAAWGIVKAGAILVPANYRYTASELRSVLTNCMPKIVIADASRQDRVEEIASEGITILDIASFEALRRRTAVPFKRHLDPRARTVIAYTSGSTAQPKGVVFTHETMFAYAFEASLIEPEYRPGARALAVAPFYTGAGTITLFQFNTLGLTIYCEADFQPERALSTLVQSRIDIFGAVPTFFERIAAMPGFDTADLSALKLASTGGARVSKELLQAWLSRGVILRQIYGLTEGGGSTTTMDKPGALEFPEKCGRGGPFTKHKIIDADGHECPPGALGEILVRGPAMMLEYWNNPAATGAAFTADGWLRTGDLGLADELGRIQIVDRLKDLIISGGLNISPIDVENVIAQFEGVIEVAVIPADDVRFGETPLAVVHTGVDIEVTRLIEHCNRHLADYKVPRYVVFEADPLPRLATGKISKRVLKEKYRGAAQSLPRVR